MCISGGLHHALRSQASGFCVYNDAGVAIPRLKEERPGIKAAYVDTDAHHGDGVQWMFFEDPDVLTVSVHETGRYLFPGTGDVDEKGRGEGKGYAVNVPLQPYTDDDSFISTFEAVVPEALRAFEPDLIISQHGCDARPPCHPPLRTLRARGAAGLRARPDHLPERRRRPPARPPDPPLGHDPPLRARPVGDPRPRPRAVRRTLGHHRRRGLRHLARRPACLE